MTDFSITDVVSACFVLHSMFPVNKQIKGNCTICFLKALMIFLSLNADGLLTYSEVFFFNIFSPINMILVYIKHFGKILVNFLP